MKKLLTLTLALFFTAGMAFAQDNTAETDQSGSDAEVTITQDGEMNFAKTEQTGQGSEIIIQQVGDENTVEDAQRTGIEDFGDNNFTRARQIGNDNKVEVGLQGPSARNDFRIDQGVSGDRSFNSQVDAFVEGFNNVIDVDQRGARQDVNMQLNGDDGARPSRNDIDIAQEGEDHRTDLNILGGSNDNVVDVSQDGSLNTATIQIGSGEGTGSASFNTVDITQTGNGHNASTMTTGSGNSSTITQSN